MRSFKFPQMFSGNNSNIWKTTEHLEATRQNLKLLLNSIRNELIGDPYFGIARLTFDQNTSILYDALADTIYTQVALFMPQLIVKRNNIKVYTDSQLGKVICTISGTNKIDYTINTFNIVLFDKSANE